MSLLFFPNCIRIESSLINTFFSSKSFCHVKWKLIISNDIILKYFILLFYVHAWLFLYHKKMLVDIFYILYKFKIIMRKENQLMMIKIMNKNKNDEICKKKKINLINKFKIISYLSIKETNQDKTKSDEIKFFLI